MLIGLMGTKGSGKDTCGIHLINQYGFIKKSFADPLKKVCQELFLFTDEQLNGTLEQKETADPRWFNCTPRKAMQYVGTELFRDHLDNIMPGLGKNIFTHHFKLWYESAIKLNPQIRIVVTDIRFENEADLIHELGGIVCKIERNVTGDSDHSNHSSELELQQLKCYDHLIDNNGTIEGLNEHLDELFSNLT